MRRDPRQYAPRTQSAQTTITNEIVESTVYDFGGTSWGPPYGSEVLLKFVAPRNFSLPAGLANSYAEAAVAATAETILSIQKNAVEVGTITFAIAGTSGTMAATDAIGMAPGDIITVVGPASPDATLADIAFTFAGTRT